MELQLQKLKCKTLLDLVLIPPKRYENLNKIASLTSLPINGVLQVRIISHCFSPKLLRIRAWAVEFEVEVEILIFNVKPFYKKLFPLGEEILIFGTLQRKMGLEMIQPKVVKEVGKILPIFPKRSLKNTEWITLSQSLITRENLQSFSLPCEVIEGILPLFHPSKSFLQEFEKEKGYPKQSLQALKFVEVFLYLCKMKEKKKEFPSKFQCFGNYDAFVKSLPFTLTLGQKNAITQIAKDLKSKIASRRLIMGDVGCGKTIVILCCVVMAYPYKSLLMVPTTILAQQLYEEAKKFLPQEIRIGFFSRQTHRGETFEDFDFVIGTQALLHKDEDLSHFALMMTDEQHRFGTMQRHQLEKLATTRGGKPHILQFSATPIPRTMAMLQSDLIDLTCIYDIPFHKDISTQIVYKKDFAKLLEHIKTEIALHHQVVIIYPLVEENENFSYASLKESEEYWRRHFQRVYTTSGGDKYKEEVIAEFREKGEILLSTTMIEVGVSLPRLSTIVIVGAERMGFATLHQLRGRVSRNGLKGYCFLFTYQSFSQRLEEFCQTSNGFEIAELDLRYRKGGDLLEGKSQSGDEFVFFNPSTDLAILQKAKQLQTQIQL